MKRKRTLTKQNEHIIEQQGGCSGLKTSCDKEELETKDMDCKCSIGVVTMLFIALNLQFIFDLFSDLLQLGLDQQ